MAHVMKNHKYVANVLVRKTALLQPVAIMRNCIAETAADRHASRKIVGMDHDVISLRRSMLITSSGNGRLTSEHLSHRLHQCH
jgi:hypothetical protein